MRKEEGEEDCFKWQAPPEPHFLPHSIGHITGFFIMVTIVKIKNPFRFVFTRGSFFDFLTVSHCKITPAAYSVYRYMLRF